MAVLSTKELADARDLLYYRRTMKKKYSDGGDRPMDLPVVELPDKSVYLSDLFDTLVDLSGRIKKLEDKAAP